jgi:hypothetical protein
VECAKTWKGAEAFDLSKKDIGKILASMPEKAEDKLPYLAKCFGLKDGMQEFFSDMGSCSKCTKEFSFFELQSDSDGRPACISCLAADAPQLDSLEGNTCSKCGEHMPGIGSAAKVMCARCRMV